MPSFHLVLQPSANRVYAQGAPRVTVAELAALSRWLLEDVLHDVRVERPYGIDVVAFSTDDLPDARTLAVLASVSTRYLLLEVTRNGDLRPVALPRVDTWPDDLVTIQRYPGKTNEQFTALLVNLALAAGDHADAFSGRRLRVFDPLCGRGTTLNQAVVRGHHGVGIDIDGRNVDAYRTFFGTWLKDQRAKHTVRTVGPKTTFDFSRDKEAERAGETQQVIVVTADTARAVDHVGKGTCDALAVDLPYGVQHGSRAGNETRRRPVDLLATSLPVWRSVLRRGAGAALAFNTRTLARPVLCDALTSAGFTLLESDGFAHRVDQSIERDVVVARR